MTPWILDRSFHVIRAECITEMLVLAIVSEADTSARMTLVTLSGRKVLEDYVMISQEHGFQCTLCHKTFNRKGHALNHLENVHFPQAFEYPCKQCDQVFPSKNQLYKHVHKEHRHFYPNS